MLDAKALVKRHSTLEMEDSSWHGLLDDVYRYVMPYRQRSGGSDSSGRSSRANGQNRTERIFDATAVFSAMRGAGRLQKALLPPYQQFFNLTPGPLVTDPEQREILKKNYDQVAKFSSAVFQTGAFETSSFEMCTDLYASMGAMMVTRGDEHELVRFMAIPADGISIEEDASGRVKRWYYPTEFAKEDLLEQYPKSKIPKDLLDIWGEDEYRKEQFLLTCERLQPRRFAFKVIWKAGKEQVHEEELRSSPFITPRFFKVPGERRGRGPVMMAMSHIKTANKSVELNLKAAAFALLGVWMTSDDDVIRARTTSLYPGGMLKVKSQSSARRPPIEKLPIPENFDLSAVVLRDLQAQIREMLFDTGLPDSNESVKSPTEIVERLKRLAEDLGAAFGRLHMELVIPLVQRVLDILYDWNMFPDTITIDQLTTSVQVTSPLADAQALEQVSKAVQWFELIVATHGEEEAKIMTDPDQLGSWFHEKMGVDGAVIRPKAGEGGRDEMRQQIQAAAEAAIQAQLEGQKAEGSPAT